MHTPACHLPPFLVGEINFPQIRFRFFFVIIIPISISMVTIAITIVIFTVIMFVGADGKRKAEHRLLVVILI